MLNEEQVKDILIKSTNEFIRSLESSSLYYAQYESEMKTCMKILDDKDMLKRYEFICIDKAKLLLNELGRIYIDLKEVITNIFEYKKIEIIAITSKEVYYRETEGIESVSYEVNDDVITFTRKTGTKFLEENISSYINFK